MRKNIRRSLVVAAAASGIWALSAAGASAAELPVAHDGDAVTKTVHSVTHTVQKTTKGAASGVTEKLPTKGIPENGLPTNTLPTDRLPAPGDVSGATNGPTGKLDAGSKAAKSATDAKLADKSGKANKAVKEAQQGIGSATQYVPSVRPVAGQAITDLTVTVEHGRATVTPFAKGAAMSGHILATDVAGRVTAFGEDARADSVPFAQELNAGTSSDLKVLARHAASGVQTIRTVPSTGDLTDAANIPALPTAANIPALPAGAELPVVPAV